MRGIRRSIDFETIVRRLAEEPHPDAGRAIFPTMRELMCFAAVLGFENDRRHPLQSKTAEIDGRNFANSPQALDLLYLIALASKKDAEVLRDENEDEMISIFEEYAQGGFEVLQGWLKDKPEDPNGDQAILAALGKYGFLSKPEEVESVINDITF